MLSRNASWRVAGSVAFFKVELSSTPHHARMDPDDPSAMQYGFLWIVVSASSSEDPVTVFTSLEILPRGFIPRIGAKSGDSARCVSNTDILDLRISRMTMKRESGWADLVELVLGGDVVNWTSQAEPYTPRKKDEKTFNSSPSSSASGLQNTIM